MGANRKVVLSYMTPEEHAKLQASAKQAGLSVSTYIKRICLGMEVRATADYEAVRVLLKANADLGRLGGLFKMALTEGKCREFAFEHRQILRKIEDTQRQVMHCCQTVTTSLKRGQMQAK